MQDTAFVLIDHQAGIFDWIKSIDRTQLRRNALMLTKLAARAELPVVLTTSQETNVQGPLMKGMQKALPEAYAKRVRRVGIVNAWDVKAFADAVRATGKRNLVMAGVTTDVCVIAPAISAVEEGFNVQVVTDASDPGRGGQSYAGSGKPLPRDFVADLVAELVYNWDTDLGDYACPFGIHARKTLSGKQATKQTECDARLDRGVQHPRDETQSSAELSIVTVRNKMTR